MIPRFLTRPKQWWRGHGPGVNLVIDRGHGPRPGLARDRGPVVAVVAVAAVVAVQGVGVSLHGAPVEADLGAALGATPPTDHGQAVGVGGEADVQPRQYPDGLRPVLLRRLWSTQSPGS